MYLELVAIFFAALSLNGLKSLKNSEMIFKIFILIQELAKHAKSNIEKKSPMPIRLVDLNLATRHLSPTLLIDFEIKPPADL